MAANDTLSGRQFFHATTANLKEGDVVRPGSKVGRNNHPQLRSWRNQSVWLSDNEKDSWNWARLGDSSERKTVYEVEPHDEPKQRRKLDGMGGKEYTAPAATVKRRIDIPPPEGSGWTSPSKGVNGERIDPEKGTVQGTLLPAHEDEPFSEARWDATGRKDRNERAFKAEQNARRRRNRAGKKVMPTLPGIG